jgi:predicted Na+-dependent transporter
MAREMARIGSLSETALPWLVAVAAVIGLALPGPGRVVAGHGGVQAVLVVLVFATGLGISPGAAAAARRASTRVTVAVAVGVVCLPALAWAASRMVEPGPLRQGVVALGIAPTEIAAVAITAMAAGNAAVTAIVLVITSLLTVGLAGPALAMLSAGSANPPLTVLVTLLVVVGLPLAAGAALRRTRVGGAGELLSSPLSVATVVVLVWLVASQAELSAALVPAALAVVTFLAGSVALGEVVAYRAGTETSHALRLSLGMRDFAVAAGAATAAFGPAAAAPAGLYGIVVLGYGAAYARLRTAPAGDEATLA